MLTFDLHPLFCLFGVFVSFLLCLVVLVGVVVVLMSVVVVVVVVDVVVIVVDVVVFVVDVCCCFCC